MAVVASVIISRAQKILLDTSGVRWDSAELLGWINDAQREISLYKPSESIRRDVLAMAQGTYQRVAADSTRILSVVSNLRSVSPRVAGRSVTMVALDVMNIMHPRWQEEGYFPYASEAKHVSPDPADEGAFYVFPGNDGTGKLEVVVAVPPALLTADTQSLVVRDVYANAVLDYVLYRAFSKDSESPNTSERAGGHYAMFSAAIGIKATVEG